MNSVEVALPPVITKLGTMLVDYNFDLEKSIRRCQLDFVQPDIFVNLNQFKTGREGIRKIDISIVHFNRPIGLLPAIQELSRLAFRGADFLEFLEMGFRRRCLQCQFPLLAAGAGCKNNSGDCGVPYLWYNHRSGDRTLLLNQTAGFQERTTREFQPFCRFVAVANPV